jgi:hypothetical protein
VQGVPRCREAGGQEAEGEEGGERQCDNAFHDTSPKGSDGIPAVRERTRKKRLRPQPL